MILRALLLLSVLSAWTCGSPQNGQRWLIISDDLAYEGGGWV